MNIDKIKSFNNYIMDHDPSINDVFVRVINQSKDVLQLNNLNYAIRFGVSEQKISLWMEGDSLPPIEFRKIIFDWLSNKSNIDVNSINELIVRLKETDIESDRKFSDIVQLAMLILPISEYDFVNQFDMSQISLIRWRNGNASPHPMLRQHVLNWFIAQAELVLASPSDNGTDT